MGAPAAVACCSCTDVAGGWSTGPVKIWRLPNGWWAGVWRAEAVKALSRKGAGPTPTPFKRSLDRGDAYLHQ